MFTIRLISETDKRHEYNILCGQYRKDIEGNQNSIECFDVVGEDGYERFDIDGDPYTHCYVMNPAGKTIDTLLSPVNAADYVENES